jgi:hypothetical protein
MSTKIFVHRRYKEPKPDPVAMAQSVAAMEERARREAKRAETKRIMSELRLEELFDRAAKMPPPPERDLDAHCPRCWGMNMCGDLLGSHNKIMWRLYKGERDKRPELMTPGYLTRVHTILCEGLFKAARVHQVELDKETIEKIAISVVERTRKSIRKTTTNATMKPYVVELPHGLVGSAYPLPPVTLEWEECAGEELERIVPTKELFG